MGPPGLTVLNPRIGPPGLTESSARAEKLQFSGVNLSFNVPREPTIVRLPESRPPDEPGLWNDPLTTAEPIGVIVFV
jgi:hypothetical protein